MKILWHGCDKLDIALQAIIPQRLIDQLEELRAKAEAENERQRAGLGPGGLQAHVEPFGLKGGYRFQIDTGITGFRISLKSNTDRNHWNIFASASTGALMTQGFDGAVEQLWDELAKLGIEPKSESVNRFDYAIDIALDELPLDPALLIVPPGTKIAAYSEPPDIPKGRRPLAENSFVMKGGRIQTLTCGKMPGRQVILYDKIADIVAKKKFFMFDVWKTDPRATGKNVLRIEFRAGKRELKDRWAIRSLKDVRNSIGDVLTDASRAIRLLAPGQGDSNFSRQASHGAWTLAQNAVADGLQWAVSGLARGQFVKREREQVSEHASQMMMAHLFRKVAATGLKGLGTKEACLLALSGATKEFLQIPESELERRFAKAAAKIVDIKPEP